MNTIAQNDPVITGQNVAMLRLILKVSGAENIQDITFNIKMLGSNSLIRSTSSESRIIY